MEPLDPKAELMALADIYAVRNREQDEGDSGDSYDAVVESRAALFAAITLALAVERRRALEEAADLCVTRNAGAYAQAIRALIDGKTA